MRYYLQLVAAIKEECGNRWRENKQEIFLQTSSSCSVPESRGASGREESVEEEKEDCGGRGRWKDLAEALALLLEVFLSSFCVSHGVIVGYLPVSAL